MRIATLGPKGTCSEETALAYLADLGIETGEHLDLCASFEEAADRVLSGEADLVIVPAAYKGYNDIVFRNFGQLRTKEVLCTLTPEFVLAGRKSIPMPSMGRTYSIASHPSPEPLLDRLTFPHSIVKSSSNSDAAWRAAKGETDLCLTNSRALDEVNGEVVDEQCLHVIEHFGATGMEWAVFERGEGDEGEKMRRRFRTAQFGDSSYLNPESVEQWLAEQGIDTDVKSVQQGIVAIPSAAESDQLLAEDHSSTKPTALFVDNDPDAFALIPECFPDWRWKYAPSPGDALKVLSVHDADVAFIDVGLIRDNDATDKSGAMLLEKIRRRNPDVPVIMITGYARSDELAAFCFRHGAIDYLRKPLDPDRLTAWLDIMHRRWRAQRVGTTYHTKCIAADCFE